jgi:hypothetical protein
VRARNWPRRSLRINLAGVEDTVGDDAKLVPFDPTKKTALVTFVAGRSPTLPNFQEDRVGVTIDEDGFHCLGVPALFPFPPKTIPAPAIITGESSPERFLIGFSVHISQHEDIARLGVLDDRRDQAIHSIEIGGQLSLLKPERALNSFRSFNNPKSICPSPVLDRGPAQCEKIASNAVALLLLFHSESQVFMSESRFDASC